MTFIMQDWGIIHLAISNHQGKISTITRWAFTKNKLRELSTGKPHQNTEENFTTTLLEAQHKKDSVEENLACCVLKKNTWWDSYIFKWQTRGRVWQSTCCGSPVWSKTCKQIMNPYAWINGYLGKGIIFLMRGYWFFFTPHANEYV